MGAEQSAPDRAPSEDVKPRAQLAKRQIEVYYRDLFTRHHARAVTAAHINALAGIDDVERNARKREQFLREFEYLRRRQDQPISAADFEFVRKIGHGSFGEVFLVRLRSTSELYALKKIPKEDMLRRRQVSHLWLERYVLATVGHHPNVVKMFFSFQDRTHLYFVMEYLPGGDMLTMMIRMDTLPENWARFYIAEIIVALDALHRTGIIHRDVKPDNVIFGDAGHIRLSDFGLSKSLFHIDPGSAAAAAAAAAAADSSHANPSINESRSDEHLRNVISPENAISRQRRPLLPAISSQFLDSVRVGANVTTGGLDIPIIERMAAWKAIARLSVLSTVGTPNYIAPEVLQQISYSESADWWSVGIILYEMLVGYPPFWSKDSAQTYAMIMRADQCLDFPHHRAEARPVSPEAEDLIRRLVCDQKIRLGSRRGLEEFKEHPFFSQVQWDRLDKMKAPFVPELSSDTDTRYFDIEVTSQSVPPPPSPFPTDGLLNTNSSPDGLLSIDRDDTSFPSKAVSQGTLPLSSAAMARRATASIAPPLAIPPSHFDALQRPSSIPPASPPVEIAARPTRRTHYDSRCTHPEFVGFSFRANGVPPSRRRINPDMFTVPAAKSAPVSALAAAAMAATEYDEAKRGVAPRRRPRVLLAESDTDTSTSGDECDDDHDVQDFYSEDEAVFGNIQFNNEDNFHQGDSAAEDDGQGGDLRRLFANALDNPLFPDLDEDQSKGYPGDDDVFEGEQTPASGIPIRQPLSPLPFLEGHDRPADALGRRSNSSQQSIMHPSATVSLLDDFGGSDIFSYPRPPPLAATMSISQNGGMISSSPLLKSMSSPEYLDRDLKEELRTDLWDGESARDHPAALTPPGTPARTLSSLAVSSEAVIGSAAAATPSNTVHVHSDSEQSRVNDNSFGVDDINNIMTRPSSSGFNMKEDDQLHLPSYTDNGNGQNTFRASTVSAGRSNMPTALMKRSSRSTPPDSYASEGRLQVSLDVATLEERSIVVPSTREVDSFVSAALEEMHSAAAELHRPVTDLASLVDDVTSDLSGTARELNKSIVQERTG
jgi:serine/threonine kinase 38